MKQKPIYSFFKRLFDFIFAFLAIIIFSVPMIIVGIVIKTDSKGPVFFTQNRIGKKKSNSCCQITPSVIAAVGVFNVRKRYAPVFMAVFIASF